MVASIGLMLGMFILTRMCELLETTTGNRQWVAAPWVAGITLLIALLGMADILWSSDVSQRVGQFRLP